MKGNIAMSGSMYTDKLKLCEGMVQSAKRRYNVLKTKEVVPVMTWSLKYYKYRIIKIIIIIHKTRRYHVIIKKNWIMIVTGRHRPMKPSRTIAASTSSD